jgi:hypothetical protein
MPNVGKNPGEIERNLARGSVSPFFRFAPSTEKVKLTLRGAPA